MYELPTFIMIDGIKYPIRNKGDYRVILDILVMLEDANLSEQEKAICTLKIFYEDWIQIPEDKLEIAVKEAFKFIDLGEEPKETPQKAKLMDWEQDFKIIVSPINRVLGKEIRALDYLHWWTFMSAYYEIGDCLFANVVSIRNKKAKGKKLEKYEQDFYKENIDMIKIKTKTTDAEDELLKEILGY